MEDDVITILGDFGKSIENDEVLDKIVNLGSIYDLPSNEVAHMLLNFLNTEKITNEIITSNLIDDFEKQRISNPLNQKNKCQDIKVPKKTKNVVLQDTSFLSSYLDESEIMDFNTSITSEKSQFFFKDNIDNFQKIDWHIKVCEETKSDYRAMFQKNFKVFEDIERLDEEICKSQLKMWNQSQIDNENKIDFSQFGLLGISHQEEVYIAGQISFDHSQTLFEVDKINTLEFDNEYNGPETVISQSEKLTLGNVAIQSYSQNRLAVEPLIFNSTTSFSIFPGENVILKGKNPMKTGFSVSSILPKFVNPTPLIEYENVVGDLHVAIATGPFGSNDFSGLKNLLKQIQQNRCHVLIIMGPFVDADKFNNENRSHEDMFLERMIYLVEKCLESDTQLIVLPAPTDATELSIYPQPPFHIHDDVPMFKDPRIHFVSNPASFFIGPYKFSCTSVDILRHLSTQEISRNCPDGRIKRLCHHILAESNFYPLKPAHSEISIDWRSYVNRCKFGPESPHCLILPSKLNTFVEGVGDVLCINPGFINRDGHRSTYCQLAIPKSLFPTSSTGTITDKINFKIISL